MPGRCDNLNAYRFAYNGMEKDDDIKGDGNSYTTEFRQYDPRLGRWTSLDPLLTLFPDQSPYAAFNNNPVYFNDPYGLSAGTDGEGGPPAQKTNEAGESVDWEKGDTWEDESGTVYRHTGQGWALTEVPEFEAVEISANSLATQRQLYLESITMQGTLDALADANLWGMYNLFGNDHYDEFDEIEEKRAYLTGQIAGYTVAAVQGGVEIQGGLGGGAALALPTGGSSLIVGTGVAIHGTGVLAVATSKVIMVQIKLLQLEANAGSEGGTGAEESEDGGEEVYDDYEKARNEALEWLESKGFKAEKPVLGKFGENKGKPIGYKTSDGKTGFRVEYDKRNGAHINVWNSKDKGKHYRFKASEETVNNIIKRFTQ